MSLGYQLFADADLTPRNTLHVAARARVLAIWSRTFHSHPAGWVVVQIKPRTLGWIIKTGLAGDKGGNRVW